jgi:hypothetical protein
MPTWFKDDQRVLVYPPGAGGEYITAVKNSQDLSKHWSLSKGAPGRNRYSSHNSFPGHDYIFDLAQGKPSIAGEWTDECRVHFNSESAIKKFLDKKDPTGKWRQTTGDPDQDIVKRHRPVGEDDFAEVVFVQNPIWFPTHYDYGVFRDPVWKWLDFDSNYWMVHWSMCIFFKSMGNIVELSHEFNWRHPATTWHQDRHLYRNYYNQKFPNARISVDDKEFRKTVNYIEWAELNLEAMKKHLDDTNQSNVINPACWDYLNNAMPR